MSLEHLIHRKRLEDSSSDSSSDDDDDEDEDDVDKMSLISLNVAKHKILRIGKKHCSLPNSVLEK